MDLISIARKAALVCTLAVIASTSQAQTSTTLDVMPLPSSYKIGTGQLVVGPEFTVAINGNRNPMLERAALRFLGQLTTRTGIPYRSVLGDPKTATVVITVEHTSDKPIGAKEDESYSLEVHASGAKLHAATQYGALHGLQTLLQLVNNTPEGFAVADISIQDAPRFPWRGLLIDVSRHFIPIDVLERNVDGMAAVKLNILHWHLSDNEGFRVQSKKLPRLTEQGSDGMFYTQAQIRDFIAYAQDRGIRVVPEFDMPGHSNSWFLGYPEMASAPGPFKLGWDPNVPVMDPTKESTYKLLDKFIGEMSKLFPDTYFHIGGDEVEPKAWESNPKIKEFMQKHDLKTPADLQAYFNAKLQKIVRKHGKIMVGWDEVLRPDLPKDVVVQSWRGDTALVTAAKEGHPTLLSHGYYLDLMWSAARHYASDPLPPNAPALAPEVQARILGGEACMWAEFASAENISYRIWPRLAVIAERLWSPADVRDVNSMYTRMDDLNWRFELLGLKPQSPMTSFLRRISGNSRIDALSQLSEVVEPVKDYVRPSTTTAPQGIMGPLNRLVDVVPPESRTSERFADLVNRYLSSGAQDEQIASQIRAALQSWRDSPSQLGPTLQQSSVAKELEPVSRTLSDLSAKGLEALDMLERRQRAPSDWATQAGAVLQQGTKPGADLVIAIVPAIDSLVRAASGESASPMQNHVGASN